MPIKKSRTKKTSESIRQIALENKIPKKLVRHIIYSFIHDIKETILVDRDEFRVDKLFIIKYKQTHDREHYNIATGEFQECKGRDIPYIRSVKSLKQDITKNK